MKLQKGINDLATAFPQLLAEWVYEKNDINPNEIYYGSTKIVWWKCPVCKNEYDTSVRIRANGSNCPYCSGQRVLKGFNDLATWCKNNGMSYLLEEWDDKLNNLTPFEVTRGTHKKVWWNCKECNNSWEASVVSRTKGIGCPQCGKKKIWNVRRENILNQKASLFEVRPELKEEWDFEKNDIDPARLTEGSGERVWWICKRCQNNWKTSIVNRVRGTGCPECGKKKIWEVRRINLLDNKANLFSTNPELKDEWDYEKNTIDPLILTEGSHKKVWWVCRKCGYNWEAYISSRTRGRGCPACAKETGLITRHNKIIERRGSLSEINPDFLKEWDYEKNTTITPNDITANSNEKAWWICSVCGNSWYARVGHRFNGVGCPQCARDKQSSFPEQAIYYYIKQLFPDAINGDRNQISPYELDIFIPSNNIAIEYDGQAFHKLSKRDVVKNSLCTTNNIHLYRIREDKCDYFEDTEYLTCIYLKSEDKDELNTAIKSLINLISKKSIDVNVERDNNNILSQYIHKKKENSLALNNPDLVAEWDYQKNGSVTPEMVSAGSDKKFWWLCSLGHSYKTSVANKTGRNRGCPYCAKKKLLVGFNDFATCYPDIASEWDYDKNDIKPSEVIGGAKKIWWRCPNGHSYSASMNSRTNRKSGCPICAGIKVIEGVNDLKTVAPEIAKEWDYDKNIDLVPEDILLGSNKKVWWICSNGHSYQMSVYDRRHSGCPYCAGKKVLEGFNDFKFCFPELAKEWDYEKNELKPNQITSGTSRKVWWICPKNHSYQASVAERTGQHATKCPYCANRKILIGYNDLETTYPDLMEEWDYKRNSFTPKEVVNGTSKKAWWICKKCGNSWQANISTRTKNGYGCPRCAKLKKNK